MARETYIEAGKIVNTHGIKGDVKIEVWLNSPEMLKSCGRIFVGPNKREMKIISGGAQKGFLLAHLSGIDDINMAMTLKNSLVFIHRDDAKLRPGEYFLSDLIGCKAVEENGTEIGRIVDIYESPASSVYIIRGEQEHMIPAVPEFIRAIDFDQNLVTVHLIEGM